VDCNHYFFRAKNWPNWLVNKFWGRLRYFYDHLSDFLQPDFLFGIFLSLIATISWAFGLYTKKSGLQSLFQSWITNGNIEQLPFIITGATGTAVNITSIPAISWWAIAYLVIIGSVLSFIAFIYMIQNFRRKLTVFTPISIIAVLLAPLSLGKSSR
jgi:drug/metabolite transporter (DMT)-like permease